MIYLVVGLLLVGVGFLALKVKKARKGASFTVAVAADVPVSPETLWDVITDVENPSYWPEGIKGFRWLNDDRTRYELKTNGGALDWTIEDERPLEYSIRSYAIGPHGVGVIEIRLEPVDDITHIDVIHHCQPTTPMLLIQSFHPKREAAVIAQLVRHLLTVVDCPDVPIEIGEALWTDEAIAR